MRPLSHQAPALLPSAVHVWSPAQCKVVLPWSLPRVHTMQLKAPDLNVASLQCVGAQAHLQQLCSSWQYSVTTSTLLQGTATLLLWWERCCSASVGRSCGMSVS